MADVRTKIPGLPLNSATNYMHERFQLDLLVKKLMCQTELFPFSSYHHQNFGDVFWGILVSPEFPLGLTLSSLVVIIHPR